MWVLYGQKKMTYLELEGEMWVSYNLQQQMTIYKGGRSM